MRFTAVRLDVAHGFLVTDDDRVCPITKLLDRDGQPTTDASEATVFLADAGYCWINGRVEDYPPATIH